MFSGKAFKIKENDNVATALEDISVGEVQIIGEAADKGIHAIEDIIKGHKIALADIKKGEYIIKYGVVICISTEDIKKGQWVHLHNCKSLYDESSSKLDINTGAHTDTQYI